MSPNVVVQAATPNASPAATAVDAMRWAARAGEMGMVILKPGVYRR
jgi:hypothetical protein